MNHTVFISHSVKDRDQEAANRVYDYLESNGIKCFMDIRDLVLGKPYPDQITKAIKESSVLVLVFSANSDSSDAVQNEVGFAKNNKVPIIPLRTEDVMPDRLAIFITTAQWLDAFPPPVEKHLPKLVDAIKQHMCEDQGDKTQQKIAPSEGRTKIAVDEPVTDYEWHDIDKEDLSPWALKRIKELDSDKQISGRTFMYRRNRYNGKYQRKLKPPR